MTTGVAPSTAEFKQLRTIADYQFGATAGRGLFPDREELTVRRTSSGRIEQVHAADGRLVTWRTDGRFTISVAGGCRLVDTLPAPRNRVTVGDESTPYIRDGRNAFAKFVRSVDPAVRPGDEVVVMCDDTVIGVGRAELSASAMQAFETGMAVSVRHGADG